MTPTILPTDPYCGQTMTVTDRRTRASYRAEVVGVRRIFGRLEVSMGVDEDGRVVWFQPSKSELASLGDIHNNARNPKNLAS